MHWPLLTICIMVAIAALSPVILRASLGVRVESAKSWRERVELRYQRRGTWTWMFCRFKLRLDPMFQELPEFIGDGSHLRNVLDLGCGHGVAGCAMIEWFPKVTIYGVEPRANRVSAARDAMGNRGIVRQGAAPDFEWQGLPEKLDAALVLDMMHFLDDEQFVLTLMRIRQRLRDGGAFFMRCPMAPAGSGSWSWKIDRLVRGIRKIPATYRSWETIQKVMQRVGFQICKVRDSGGNPELYWFIAKAGDAETGATESR